MGSESLAIPNDESNLLFLLLGALITFISAYSIEIIKNWLRKREKSKNFKLFIRLELVVIAKTLEKLQTGLEYGAYYDYLLLDRIAESIKSLDKARTDVIYLTDSVLKEKFVDVISEISNYIAVVRQIQQLFYSDRDKAQESKSKSSKNPKTKTQEATESLTIEGAVELFHNRKIEKNIIYVEIKRKLEDLINDLEN